MIGKLKYPNFNFVIVSMSVIKNKTIIELNDDFKAFINESILTKEFANYSATSLYKVSAGDWFDKRSKYLTHRLIFGSQEDYVNKNTFLLIGLAILSSKVMNQLNNSATPKNISLLKTYLKKLEDTGPQELNHSQLNKSSLFYIDFKKHIGKDIVWDEPTVDYVRLKNGLVERLRDYIDTVEDIRFKDFSSVKVSASKKMTKRKVESPFFTVKEAASYCKVHRSTIYNHLNSDKLVYDAGDKSQGYKFLKKTLDDYLGKI